MKAAKVVEWATNYRRFTAAIARSYTASTFAAAPSQVMPRTSK
jgi:hypothetical protein